MDALAERWELRIHAIALTLTAVVLAMRLVAGRQDLIADSDWQEPPAPPPTGEVLGMLPADAQVLLTEPELRAQHDR